jgi:16S rRNA (uracil1498-N3)-methyltransferase
VVDGHAVLEGGDALHLARSLRARSGERIVVVDDSGREHGIRLEQVGEDRVEGSVEWSRPATGEAEVRVHVVQALAKEGMDDAVEALAEAGVAEVWPVLTERTVSRPDPARARGRVERWQTVAREAAGLAGRGAVPLIHPLLPLADALAVLPVGTRVFALTVDAPTPLARIGLDPSIAAALVIGPEGGLGPRDLADLEAAGAEEAHLGPRVLRTRLAGAVAASILMARCGELGHAVARPPLALVRGQ